MTHLFSKPAKAAYFAESKSITNAVIEELYSRAFSQEDRDILISLGFIRNQYEEVAGFLTFAERKINLARLAYLFGKLESQFTSDLRNLTDAGIARLVEQATKIVENQTYEELMGISSRLNWEVASLYADTMKGSFDMGKMTASDELSISAPKTSQDLRGIYRVQADWVERQISSDMENLVRSEVTYQVGKWVSAKLVIESVEKALRQKIDKVTSASSTIAVGGAFNSWRLAIYEANKDRIFGFQYTAVLDGKTTNLCQSLHWRVIAPNDSDFFRLSPPLHPHCRSFWVEILTDEFIKPALTEIPDSIKNKVNTWYTNFLDLKKSIPLESIKESQDATTRAEKLIAKNGVVDDLIQRLGDQGVKFK